MTHAAPVRWKNLVVNFMQLLEVGAMTKAKEQEIVERYVRALAWMEENPKWLATRPNIRKLAQQFKVDWKQLSRVIRLDAQGYFD